MPLSVILFYTGPEGMLEEGSPCIAAPFSGIQTARVVQTEVRARGEYGKGKPALVRVLQKYHLVLMTCVLNRPKCARQEDDWAVPMSRDFTSKKRNLSLQDQ